MSIEKHQGQIVERVVRRSQISIAELARIIGADRRSLYNWFEKSTLNDDIINNIGRALDYDFSRDIPKLAESGRKRISDGLAEHDLFFEPKYWMNKYFDLKEKYKRLKMDGSISDHN